MSDNEQKSLVEFPSLFPIKIMGEQHPEFRGYFKAVIVGEMVENAKPAPDCFLLGPKLLDIDIKNCYIFLSW